MPLPLPQRHYMRSLLPQLPQVVGSASFFGDPVRLFHHLGLGVWSLVASPAAGGKPVLQLVAVDPAVVTSARLCVRISACIVNWLDSLLSAIVNQLDWLLYRPGGECAAARPLALPLRHCIRHPRPLPGVLG